MAVLQLAADGPDIPGEVELAGAEELGELEGRPVGFLGYPIRIGAKWPDEIHPTSSTFSCCEVGAMSNSWTHRNPSVPVERRQYLVYDYDLGAGASGCPIFSAKGHVVGMATNGSETLESDGRLTDFGPRIDCLRELLSYHNLGDTNVAHSKKRESRGLRARPTTGKFRTAVQLVAEAETLRLSGRYDESRKKCDAALVLAPNYGRGLLQRSKALLYDLGTHWTSFDSRKRLEIAETALGDAARSCELLGSASEAWLITIQLKVYLAYLESSREGFQDSLKTVQELIDRDWPYAPLSKDELSFAVNLRGQCNHFLGDAERAEKDYTESIKLAPNQPRWYENRAQYSAQQGKKELADADQRLARAAAGRISATQSAGSLNDWSETGRGQFCVRGRETRGRETGTRLVYV